jgi:hypothetical protein
MRIKSRLSVAQRHHGGRTVNQLVVPGNWIQRILLKPRSSYLALEYSVRLIAPTIRVGFL